MSKLEDFLNLEDVSNTKKEITINVFGKELTLVVKPISEKEHSSMQKRCQEIKGNKMSFDDAKYNSLVLNSCIVEPNFKDAKFLEKVNCVSAEDFLNKKFPAGVLTDIAKKIQELSGFKAIEMEIESAKN